MLSPEVGEDNEVIDVSWVDAIVHFFSIGWKVLFAIIPPPRACKGWASFCFSLFFIGCVTAVIGEFASLFGCVLGVKPSVTAITFVALGTSLPDTFASR